MGTTVKLNRVVILSVGKLPMMNLSADVVLRETETTRFLMISSATSM